MQSVEDFLKLVKKCDKIDIVPRRKNRITRYRLNITLYDQQEMIRGLTKEDFVCGPEPDHDPTRKGMVWTFKRRAYGTKIFIKIKDIEYRDDGSSHCTAISCHIDYLKSEE